uniref:AP_endonuc_2 domain-containing protein n=1 Tax=Globodera pallida TaxID=36090 RepID=A0A183CBE1_GLOPA
MKSSIVSELEEEEPVKPTSTSSALTKREVEAKVELGVTSKIVYMSNTAISVITAGLYSKKNLGVHVSAAGSLENAIWNAIEVGCRSFALFIRNQRRWEAKPMDESVVDRWNRAIKETKFPLHQIVPHGSYLLNAGSPDDKKLEMTRKAMLDECRRCERLGIQFYNFHPGSTTGKCTREQSIKTIAETISYVQENTDFITLVVETMAGSGNTIGGAFAELRSIIDQVHNKKRVGVCLDTCHIFAAGYDMVNNYEEVMEEFDSMIGFDFLKAVHLNDSKGGCSSKVDRHENIGKGNLGTKAFERLMKDDRFNGIPMILETPEGKYPQANLMDYKQLYDCLRK